MFGIHTEVGGSRFIIEARGVTIGGSEFIVQGWGLQSVRSTSLFELENRNPTRLVQKPKWTRLRGKSENVYSGTHAFWFFRD